MKSAATLLKHVLCMLQFDGDLSLFYSKEVRQLKIAIES